MKVKENVLPMTKEIEAGLSASSTQISAWKLALLSLIIGGGLVFLVGLASPQAIHDAAHDTRHAIGFPCH